MRKTFWSILLALFVLTGCAGTGDASIRDGWQQPLKAPITYKVKSKDTLYSIAWRYGLDYREVASLNSIDAPSYHIRTGQKLRLVPSRNPSTATTQPTIAKTSVDENVVSAAVVWRWPAQGEIIRSYSVLGLNKGIDIAGKKDMPVLAAGAGKVVYSGNGLRGYGELIIIKHNDEFLSAYAHNQKLLVREGETVQAGQEIAKMGSTGAKQVMLHFEIRRAGKPVDPLKYLPARS